MKDLKNTILEDLSPKIVWDDFIKACWSYFKSKNNHINMYDVFDLPPRSRTGLPKVLPTALKAESGKNLVTLLKAQLKHLLVKIFACWEVRMGVIGYKFKCVHLFQMV